ncbi:hypothetical protein AB0425_09230 [Actinosynnema sp. NPDC051121]
MVRTVLGLAARVATGLVPAVLAPAGDTGQLDESIRVPAAAPGPLQGTTERLGRLVDRRPDRGRRTQGLPG